MRPTVLITAGPTREKIDPVRFISNYSTGTFGYEIAKEAKRRGCRVILISGPTSLLPPRGVEVINVESARQMRRSAMSQLPKADCVIMAAAVSDWRVASISEQKIKRRKKTMSLKLVENPDIISEMARKRHGTLVGFALETENLEHNAEKKLKEKGLDIIVANNITDSAQAFGDGPTDVFILDRLGNKMTIRRKTKDKLAGIILDKALKRNGFTLIELVMVVAVFLLTISALGPFVRFAKARAYNIKCANNLRHISLGLHSYAVDHDGAFPQNLGSLYPNYVQDQASFNCPASRTTGTPAQPDYKYIPGLSETSPLKETIAEDLDGNHRNGKNILRIDGSMEWAPRR